MELPEQILAYLDQKQTCDTLKLAEVWNVDHQKVVGAVKSLECLGDLIQAEAVATRKLELTKEGQEVLKRGSHEAVVFNAIPAGKGVAQSELMTQVGGAFGKVGFSKAMSNGWIVLDKSAKDKPPIVKRKVDSVHDVVKQRLDKIRAGDGLQIDEKDRTELKKRKLIQETLVKSYSLKKGQNFSLKIEKAETDLTPEMITSGNWKNTNFKPYNFDSLGIQPAAGHLHPLLKVRAEYRQIFLEMGFTEMPTNNFVESSFWNFDALFQPQQHPARDAHDTFFIKDPAQATEFPPDYLERVKKVHSKGGFGSQGYGYDWKIEEAQKNLLRTHTTAVSARMLYKLAQNREFKPQKYFSIDRVFRNETLDATHLAEFHQIEGVIADRGLTLGDLIGVLYEFFRKLGIEKLRFKPAYNPYTEPSMEIFSYHEGLEKWVEIGNSGIFRPEMLQPMGLPEDVNVVAWGLSLERPTMIKYGIDNIRDLCGNKVNLKMVQENPICRLDKTFKNPTETLIEITENRWDNIEEKLKILEKRLSVVKRNFPTSEHQPKLSSPDIGEKISNRIVITACPEKPPHYMNILIKALQKEGHTVNAKIYVHSSVKNLPNENLKDFLSVNNSDNNATSSSSPNEVLHLDFIWKSGKFSTTTLCVRPGLEMVGNSEICRFFSRFLNLGKNFAYDHLPVNQAALMDSKLDLLLAIENTNSTSERKALVNKLISNEKGNKKDSWICGTDLSIADILLWNTLKNSENEFKELKIWTKQFETRLHQLLV